MQINSNQHNSYIILRKGFHDIPLNFGSSGSAEASCAEVGKQMLAYGREVPAAEMVLRIDAIDSEEVKRVAWQYLNDSDIAFTALGLGVRLWDPFWKHVSTIFNRF